MPSEITNLKDEIHDLIRLQGIEIDKGTRKIIDAIALAVDGKITRATIEICHAIKGKYP